MKILVVGAGSIGKRHAANAQALADEAAIFDTDHTQAAKTGLKSFTSLDDAFAWKPDGVVVATPHKTHLEIARKAIAAGAHVLIEKPISHTLDGMDDFLRPSRSRIYVVCNMRFHPAIRALHDNIALAGNIYYARAQYGNYLPNMRPDSDYKKLYCSHKSEGGGVILDAIHEIDYLSWLFGPVQSVSAESDKRSNLDIDVEDYAALSLHHINGIRSEIHLDYLQQCKRRGCEIAGSAGTLIWESTGKNPEHCTVKAYTAGQWKTLYESPGVDAGVMYRDLMTAFIDELRIPDSRPDLLRGTDAVAALRAALAAHRSASEGIRMEIEDERPEGKTGKQRAAL